MFLPHYEIIFRVTFRSRESHELYLPFYIGPNSYKTTTKSDFIILNPAVGRGGVCGFWGAGQGATTRNGATAQGGAVPSAGRCDPVAGCGRHKTRSRHPLRCPIPASRGPSCDAPRRPIPRSCNAATRPKNRTIRPVADSPRRRVK